MAHSANPPKNDKNGPGGPVTVEAVALLQKLDAALAADGAGYSTADVYTNDKKVGGLGPVVASRLNAICAALANGSAHYTAVPWNNDKNVGHLGADLLSKLNVIEKDLQTLRP